MSAFLLWRLLERDSATVVAGAPRVGDSLPAVPALPEPRRTSTRALLRELDTTTRRLSDPLARMQAQLEQAVARLAVTNRLPPLLSRIAGNTRGFEGVPSDLAELARDARALGGIDGSLTSIVVELARLRHAQRSLDEMARVTRLIRKDFRAAVEAVEALRLSFDATLPSAVGALERMADDVARIRACAEQGFVCGTTRENQMLPNGRR